MNVDAATMSRTKTSEIPPTSPGAPRAADGALESLRRRGWLVGTPDELVDALGRYQEAGISRVMLHHFALDADDVLELLATEVIPQLG